jgi:hypothetical protein
MADATRKAGGKVGEQLDLFPEKKKRAVKEMADLPPFEGKLQFVPKLDSLFGANTRAAIKRVREFTKDRGLESFMHGDKGELGKFYAGAVEQ